MSKKNILLLIGAVAVVAVFSFIVVNDKTPQQQLNKTNFNQGKEVDTSEWKVYRNEEYGFEVKYPEDWYWEDYTEEFKHSMIGFYPNNSKREFDYWGDIEVQKGEKNIEENLVEYFKNMFRDMPYMYDKAISKKNKNQKDTILLYDVPGYISADEILVDCDNFVISLSTPFGVATDIMKQMADELLCL